MDPIDGAVRIGWGERSEPQQPSLSAYAYSNSGGALQSMGKPPSRMYRRMEPCSQSEGMLGSASSPQPISLICPSSPGTLGFASSPQPISLGLLEHGDDLAVGKTGLLHGTSSGKITRKFHFWRQLICGGITLGSGDHLRRFLQCALWAINRLA